MNISDDRKWEKEVKSHDEEKDIEHNSAFSKTTESSHMKVDKDNYNNPLDRVQENMVGRRKLSDETSESSDMDLPHWKDEWKELWIEKKFEALNSTMPRGDAVNMLAARPLGSSCGDPNQQDAPWGSCMRPQDCDAEFRIYRGDQYCGKSTYVCCALVANKYDLYGAIDFSFAGSSFETDSNEILANTKAGVSKEVEIKERKREKYKREVERNKRKKKIIRNIKQVVKEMKSLLNKAFTNRTLEKRTKTKELKQFITNLKKKFKKDRKAVIDVHHHEIRQYDDKLQNKLGKVKYLNENFMTNYTFRELVVNGSLNKPLFMAILRSSPDMMSYIQNKIRTDGIDLDHSLKDEISDLKKQATNNTQISAANNTRRSGLTLDKSELGSGSHISGYDSEYDVEYGLLYY
ncbi:uncharacterized protein LOC111350664 [Spodoptera litura]|uniref:Uncharacterized protein LOC111350664 n=1 Tax=Spodoptera litura TaxID=69820 RepID=A0A9J7DXX8_SPOLT|nr:uncharacterized protein LOC111350664 [Spodoptera litura]